MTNNIKNNLLYATIFLFYPFSFQFFTHILYYVDIDHIFEKLIVIISLMIPILFWLLFLRNASVAPNKKLSRLYTSIFLIIAGLFLLICVWNHYNNALFVTQIAKVMYHINTIAAYFLSLFLAYLCFYHPPHLSSLYLYIGMLSILIVLRNNTTMNWDGMTNWLQIVENWITYLFILIIMIVGYVVSPMLLFKFNVIRQSRQAE